MMRFLSYLLLIPTFLSQHAIAADEYGGPPLPMDDEFYLPPEDDGAWKLSDTGTILKSREVTIAQLIGQGKSEAKGYQLLYSTKDVNGNPDVTVTTIIVPKYPYRKRVISLQNAYDSPSGYGASWNRLNLAFMAPYVRAGPILNIPDYKGSNAAFAVGPQSGYQTLDSIKAALASTELTGIKEEANVVMFGYPGGALATEWATELKATYAYDLPIIGAVIRVAPTNISQTYLNVDGGPLSDAATLGIMNAYPDMNEWMLEDLRTDAYHDKRVFKLQNTSISSFFKSGNSFLDLFKTTLNKIGVMGQHIHKTTNPSYPLAFFYGTEDEVTYPLQSSEDLIAKWKDVGKVKTVCNWPLAGKGHVSALLPGLAKFYPWMRKRFLAVEAGKGDEEILSCVPEPDDTPGQDDPTEPEDQQEEVNGQVVLKTSDELR
ncbi:uncharacterized protein N7483_012458 [Penicillium malachiteum]|uniref:uncharacterized protein n=1 Tax=Penicillium malachiteum TaxID=1324776 RepID=UPI002547292C|nr:uncharacterized protein N7483_012458 [Penicillium malachiteum]KAJ5715277.1 hypothetical protein N7483_012458 [Penicillium malachiteum]